MRLNRRQFATALSAGLALPRSLFARAGLDSAVSGVPLGVQTYSFHEIQAGGPHAVDLILRSMTGLGLGLCELFAQDLSPFPLPSWAVDAWAPKSAPKPAPPAPDQPEKLREWRLSTPATYFSNIGRRFSAAGIKIFCYNFSFEPGMTDAEIDKGFEEARALGTDIITASTTLSMARRLVPFVERHRATVSFHGHSDIHDPDQFSTPETFAKAMALSPFFKINLDIGHFTAAGLDPVAFIQAHHADITNLHIKDRKRNDGANTAFGQGDTPIREVLLLLRRERYGIPAFIEYEYVGPGTPEQEVARSLDFCRSILRS